MMVEKEDLGLSLSLGCFSTASNHGKSSSINRSLHLHQAPPPLQLNLMSSVLSSSSSSSSSSLTLASLPFASAAPQRNPWSDSFGCAGLPSEAPCSAVGGGAAIAVAGTVTGEPRSFLKGINVNRLPASTAEDDEAGVSSPNSTVSSVSGKRSERETTVGAGNSAGDDQDIERACSQDIREEDDGDTSRKKLRLSKDQSAVLEESFKEHNTLNPKQKLALAKRLGLRPRQVEVWFQNRRARTKLKQTEVDCEFLKRCCDQLTEENRRLQKEVQELRALKLSPQFYMQMTPPTTLTMCPSCERVGALPSASASASAAASTHGAGLHRRLPTTPWGVPMGQLEALRPQSHRA